MTILKFPKPFRFAPRLDESTALRRCTLAECRGACCLHGVWLDPLERDDILANAARIAPWMAAGREDPRTWFTDEREEEPAFPSGWVILSKVAANPAHYGGTECVFLRADARCALQAAADSEGLDPWRWKPFYCILHPLTFDGKGRITLAPDEELQAEEGSCLRPGGEPQPIREIFLREFEVLFGEDEAARVSRRYS